MKTSSNSQRKLMIILALIVLLPMMLLAWQGWKISKDTQQLNDARFNSLVTARLNQIDTIVQSYFEEMQLKWSLLIPQWQLDKEATRERIENDGNIRQIFVIDAQQIRTFPPQGVEITAAEKTFINRLETVWRDPQILFSNQITNPSFEQIAQLGTQLGNSTLSKTTTKLDISKKTKSTNKSADVVVAQLDKSASAADSSGSTSFDFSFNSSISSEAPMVSLNDEVAELSMESEADFSTISMMESKQKTVKEQASRIASPKRKGDDSYISQKQKISEQKQTSAKPVAINTNKQGWYMWHWGNDANLIFWQQNKDNSIIGIEMEPIRVKSDLISRLPDTQPGETKDFRLRLLDTAGHVVYQWGNYDETIEKVETIENAKGNKETISKRITTVPQQRRAVSYPLSSWSLEYYGQAFTQQGLSRFSLILSLLCFGLLISALAWFLYREQTREIRLATQRVDFVSQVSHELKTPLTNIRMYAEMLEQQVEDAEKPKRYLQVITDESKRLSRLISNVLNFSRAPRIHKREVVADDVIKQSLEHFTPSFKAKEIHIESHLDTALPIKTDPDILEQILNNLFSNVEKYAANGKQVDIKSAIRSDHFCIRVRDYGDGISRAERKHIFDPFYRINDKITEGVSGTGIGLTIAKQQAEYLGGSLEYIEVDQGACFELKLPLGVDE